MPTPIFVKRAVVDLVDERGKSVDDAFAIAIASFQKNGYIKDGTGNQLTAKGKAAVKSHAARERDDPKLPRFQEILQQDPRESENSDRLKYMLMVAAQKRVERVGFLAFCDTVGSVDLAQYGSLQERMETWLEGDEPRREGAMSLGQLKNMATNVQKLQMLIAAEDDLPEWVEKKLTLANDYLDSVAEYLANKV